MQKLLLFILLLIKSQFVYSIETVEDVIQAQRERNLNFFMQNYEGELTELECLSLAVYHEARGEGTEGMIAVAFVIQNRVKHSLRTEEKNQKIPWGTTICDTVFQDRQFSFIQDKHSDSVLYLDVYRKIVELCYDLLYNGGFTLKPSPVGKAYYFNALENPEDWRYHEYYDHIVTIGNHHFYGNK